MIPLNVKLIWLFIVLASAKVESLPALIKQVKPAVATVYIYDDKWKVINQGTGFFISPTLMVSNKHLFWKADMRNAVYGKVVTYGKEQTMYAVNKILEDSSEFDLILFTVDVSGPLSQIQPTLLVANAELELEEGEDIFVISSPLDLPGVVSTGIVSAIHNTIDIQISASISIGSSGAPIFNSHGNVVGVVTGYFTNGQNINFGVTVNALLQVVKNLQQKKQAWEALQSKRLIVSYDAQDAQLDNLLPDRNMDSESERAVNDEFGFAPSLIEWVRIQNGGTEKTDVSSGGLRPFFDALVNFPNNVLKRFDVIPTEPTPPMCPLKEKRENAS